MARRRFTIPISISLCILLLGFILVVAFYIRRSVLQQAMTNALNAGNGKVIGTLLKSHPWLVNVSTTSGQTPLLWAAAAGDMEMVKFCLEGGADPNVVGPEGLAPLHFAVQFRHRKMVELLIQAGADLNVRTELGLGPGVPLSLRESLASDPRTAQLHNFVAGDTPLHLAAGLDEDNGIVQLLVSSGARVNVKGREGDTPLHVATRGGRPELVRLLIDKGADVNATNGNNETPLAAAKSSAPTRQAPDPVLNGIKDDRTRKALIEFLERRLKKHEEVVELLRKHGAKE